jgi:hypothetical protein
MRLHVLTCSCPATLNRRARKTSQAVVLAAALQLLQLQRARGEDHVDYRYEYYQEDDNRIQVLTHGLLFDVTLKEALLAVKGELVHDAVSGATPNGAAPPSKYNFDNTFGGITGDTNSTSVPLSHMQDERKSISLEVPVTLGLHEVTPQFSYSKESDYTSTGAALNYSLLLNEKNTTLVFGWAHTWDRVRDDKGTIQDKRNDDFLLGVNQLLGPKTVLGLNLTYGQAYGYLNDPYRSIVGQDPVYIYSAPSDFIGTVEQRPEFRQKEIVRVSLTQFVTPVNASIEGAYRFYHDSFEVNAHTFELSWYQKIGKWAVVSPNFRYSYQTAAYFYYEMLPGLVTDPTTNPQYYSSDYRLSELQTFTAGLNVVVNVTDWLKLDAGYKRYVMERLDGVTSQTAYPSANVFTIGARILF